MTPAERIVFALDVPDLVTALPYIELLKPHVGAFKVGLELFMGEGPDILEYFKGSKVVLDLKLKDIPETVERAVAVALKYPSVSYLTLHVQQRETIERVMKKTEGTHITPLFVTVLTSMGSGDTLDLYGSDIDTREHVKYLARFAYGVGARGFVCSAQEISTIREYTGDDVFLMVPGIRPAGSDVGDQKRVGTPKQAVQDGANLIVVGRPIRDAASPVEAAKAIAQEIAS